MATQLSIPLNSTAPDAAKPRFTRQHQAILDRLEQGPATNTELVQIAQRFGARVKELRDAGYVIKQEAVSHARGVHRYWLTKGAGA
jgi:hypothetical protein